MNRTEYEARKTALIEEVREVFRGVSREGGVSLHETRCIDDQDDEEAFALARAKDVDARWEDVPDEDIKWGYEAMCFMDDIAHRYYLPAYLVWYLKYEDGYPGNPFSDCNTFGSLIFHLTPKGQDWEADATDQWHREQWRLLTITERRVTAKFLQLQVDRDEMLCGEYGDELLFNQDATAEELNYLASWSREECDEARALRFYWGQFLEGWHDSAIQPPDNT